MKEARVWAAPYNGAIPQTSPNAMSLRLSSWPSTGLAILLLASTGAAAQAPAAAVAAPADGQTGAKSDRIERITHEDKLARVDELRVAGQTRLIEVTPKNGAPAYEIAPAPGGADLSENGGTSGSTGKSRWRIFSF